MNIPTAALFLSFGFNPHILLQPNKVMMNFKIVESILKLQHEGYSSVLNSLQL